MTTLFLALLLQARIIAFGDSLTAPRPGVTTYSDVIAQTMPGMINRGVAGNTSAQARARFVPDVLDHHPDLVIIQLGANDAAIDVWKNPPVTKPRVEIATFRDNLEYFVRALRKQNSKIILMTSNRFAWTPRLRELYGKPPYDVNSDDGFNIMLDTYNDAVRDIAHKREVDLVDAAKAVPASALLDGMHPGTEGHRIVADLLLPVVRRLLRTP